MAETFPSVDAAEPLSGAGVSTMEFAFVVPIPNVARVASARPGVEVNTPVLMAVAGSGEVELAQGGSCVGAGCTVTLPSDGIAGATVLS